ncbi:MAG: hypothetical protein EZS28_007821 [Streblomastix strix]|uniref:Uncharacterized protein n=1 Tax=Streblomastix strix TaxID=222440 RepID=A0A5J4WP92_9EUKA|nr:MAG: hypothetical protein EZS28_007821 [Streblomastix strix]
MSLTAANAINLTDANTDGGSIRLIKIQIRTSDQLRSNNGISTITIKFYTNRKYKAIKISKASIEFIICKMRTIHNIIFVLLILGSLTDTAANVGRADADEVKEIKKSENIVNSEQKIQLEENSPSDQEQIGVNRASSPHMSPRLIWLAVGLMTGVLIAF